MAANSASSPCRRSHRNISFPCAHYSVSIVNRQWPDFLEFLYRALSRELCQSYPGNTAGQAQYVIHVYAFYELCIRSALMPRTTRQLREHALMKVSLAARVMIARMARVRILAGFRPDHSWDDRLMWISARVQ